MEYPLVYGLEELVEQWEACVGDDSPFSPVEQQTYNVVAKQLKRSLAASTDEDRVRAEVRRRMYAVAATWRVSPPTPADARISRDQEQRQEMYRQVAEDVEAWADAPDHLVPHLAPVVDPAYVAQETP